MIVMNLDFVVSRAFRSRYIIHLRFLKLTIGWFQFILKNRHLDVPQREQDKTFTPYNSIEEFTKVSSRNWFENHLQTHIQTL